MITLDQVLSTAKDIVPIKKSEGDRWTFAVPFQGEIARHYFDETVSNPAEAGVEGFKGYWKFDNETGLIIGSSTNHCLRLATKMRPDGFWLPGVPEARVLDRAGKLTNRGYRDLGVAVYNDAEPNKKIAQEIIAQAEGKQLPFLLPFGAMDYEVDKKFPEGIAISLAENPKGIITGEEAAQILSQMNYPGSSGACRVYRYWLGGYLAYWCRFYASCGDGLVDWMCAEGAPADILGAHASLMERKYEGQAQELQRQIKQLSAERDREQEAFKKALG